MTDLPKIEGLQLLRVVSLDDPDIRGLKVTIGDHVYSADHNTEDALSCCRVITRDRISEWEKSSDKSCVGLLVYKRCFRSSNEYSTTSNSTFIKVNGDKQPKSLNSLIGTRKRPSLF